MIRSQLIQLGFENPKFLSAWGFEPARGLPAMQLAAYYSLVFAFLKMAYIVGVLTDLELMGWSRNVFKDSDIAVLLAAVTRNLPER